MKNALVISLVLASFMGLSARAQEEKGAPEVKTETPATEVKPAADPALKPPSTPAENAARNAGLAVQVPAVPAKAPAAIPLMPSTEADLAERSIPGNALPPPTAQAPVMRERLDHLGNSPLPEIPVDAEVAIILHNNRFYPARVKLKEGQPTRLLFTSLNHKPAALIVEQLQVQRWIAKEQGEPSQAPAGEISRELSQNKITEVSLQPKRGTYMFHDALSGAVGEIIVE